MILQHNLKKRNFKDYKLLSLENKSYIPKIPLKKYQSFFKIGIFIYLTNFNYANISATTPEPTGQFLPFCVAFSHAKNQGFQDFRSFFILLHFELFHTESLKSC